MRSLLSARWFLIHAFAVGLIVLFAALGWWQWHRAEAGNTRSYAYALEWPTFALLVIGFWLKLTHDEVQRGSDGAAGRHDDLRPVDDDAIELAVYNRYMAERATMRDRS